MANIRVHLVVALVLVLSTGASLLHAQPWTIDFGSNPARHDSGISTNFLPTLPGINTRVRIGTQGGAVELRNPGTTLLGSGCEVALTGPTGGSLNKMQWHDVPGGTGFTLRASLLLTGGDGDVYFFTGNGNCFSDNLGFTSSQVFAGLRWTRDSVGLACAYRHAGSWTTITPCPMQADSVFQLEVYANNSSSSTTYAHGTSHALSAHSCDIWVNDMLVLDDAPSAGLADSIDIDSFMFYAAYCPTNSCTLHLDDLRFTNTVAIDPLPVELSLFEARVEGDRVSLKWRTETETQNFGFQVQRSISEGAWETREFIPGDGDRFTPRMYEYHDTLVDVGGTIRYRLKQLDRDGSTHVSATRTVVVPATEGVIIGNPWPQPARDVVFISVRSGTACELSVRLSTLAGTQVAVLPSVRLLPARRQDLRLPCPPSSRGVHVLTVDHPSGSLSKLLLFL
ncbi:MAG: hypothetical protein RBU27_13900 [Bacteroidota bacterium]|jgi:hypothetical protein|nr:hypothetical protein [Bacteroidota bacterium]